MSVNIELEESIEKWEDIVAGNDGDKGQMNCSLCQKKLTPENISQLKQLVKTLHEHKIYHRDLHLENIMVECDKNGTPTFLLSDFGLSKMLKQLEESNYDWIRNLGNSNNAIKRQIRHISPDMMIKELILYDMLINNHIRLI